MSSYLLNRLKLGTARVLFSAVYELCADQTGPSAAHPGTRPARLASTIVKSLIKNFMPKKYWRFTLEEF